ncbi:MAG: hypothetical protein ING24_13840 [Roseomonas sp.]|nr:hypothetical protein [Roseomonas sp.]MCA3343508.1 hypothetical protein [Roseomonas sp.]
MSDHKGAGLVISALSPARESLADRGDDSDGFRAALAARGITPCIPPRKNRKTVIEYNKTLHRERLRIENTLRPPKGLVTHRNPIRPLCPHPLLGHVHRSYRHLLVGRMSPEPSCQIARRWRSLV